MCHAVASRIASDGQFQDKNTAVAHGPLRLRTASLTAILFRQLEPGFMSFRDFTAIAAIALAVSATTAQGADLGARPYTKAPLAAAPIYTWTGCYIGGNVGGGWD